MFHWVSITVSSSAHTPVAESGPVSSISGWCILWLEWNVSAPIDRVQELDDRVPALERVPAAAVRRDRIRREQPGDLVPELQVQTTGVRVLQPLDLLELDQDPQASCRGAYPPSPTPPIRLCARRDARAHATSTKRSSTGDVSEYSFT